MKIDNKCYDELPSAPKELRPMLKALHEALLDSGAYANEFEDGAINYFGLWWEEFHDEGRSNF